MKPIWFFVGLMLVTMGLILFITGVYLLFVPTGQSTVFDHLHPDIWWGIVMMAVGSFFVFKNYRSK